MADRSFPLAGWRLDRPGIALSELPFLTQLSLRADPTAIVLGVELPGPGLAVRTGDVELLWLGPDEWLVLAADGRTDLLAELRAGTGAVTDVSAQRTTLRLTGEHARTLLAKGCSLDLHPAVRPAGSCLQTLLAQTGVVIVVHEDEFLLLVRSSYARYAADWLTDAAIEL